MTRMTPGESFKWHPERATIKISGPVCENCHRPRIDNNGKCLCCGK